MSDYKRSVEGKTFTFKTGYKWLLLIGGPLLSILFGWAIYIMWSGYFEKGNLSLTFFIVLMFVMVPMFLLGPASVLQVFRSFLKVTPTEFQYRGMLKDKIVSLDQIKSFRVYRDYLFLIDENGKTLLEIPSYLNNFEDLVGYCVICFDDLDQQEFEDEEQEILRDPEFGQTMGQKEENLERVHKAANMGNLLAFGIFGLWLANAYFFKSSLVYEVIILSILITPLIFILYSYKNRKFISTKGRNTRLVDTTVPIIVPCLLGCIISIHKEFLDYSQLLMPVGLGGPALILIALFFWPNLVKELGRSILAIFISGAGFIIFSCLMVFVYISILNTHFDKSLPEWHTVHVLEKTRTTGKNSSWDIKVETWGGYQKSPKYSIGQSTWKTLKEGDRVDIAVKKGLLGFKWISKIKKSK